MSCERLLGKFDGLIFISEIRIRPINEEGAPPGPFGR